MTQATTVATPGPRVCVIGAGPCGTNVGTPLNDPLNVFRELQVSRLRPVIACRKPGGGRFESKHRGERKLRMLPIGRCRLLVTLCAQCVDTDTIHIAGRDISRGKPSSGCRQRCAIQIGCLVRDSDALLGKQQMVVCSR